MTIDDRPVFRWSWKYGFWHVSNGVGPDVLHMLRCKAVSRAKDISIEEADVYIRGGIYNEPQRLPSTSRVPKKE